MSRVVVVGASGFVGSATVEALRADGHFVHPMSAPRLPALSQEDAVGYIASAPRELGRLVEQFRDVDSVVNTAGLATATSGKAGQLMAANGALPGLIAAATHQANTSRFVHISSAAVQGRRPILDDSDEFDAFSTYSRSKRLGEQLAHRFSDGLAIVYRPPGVHGADRSVTRFSAKIAASRLASVARPADSPSPQALIGNVAAGISYLATCRAQPPRTVIHPWEGLSTADVMLVLGGREPAVVPRTIARAVVTTGTTLGLAVPWVAANVRRLEMMWFGQRQATSWLTRAGWTPPDGRGAWMELGRTVRAYNAGNRSEGKAQW